MIEFLKINYFRYIFIFIIFTLFFTIICLIQEIKLYKRKKINYSNFTKLNKYYDLKINYLYLLSFVIFLLFSTFITLKMVNNSDYRKYALIIPLLNILVFPSIYLHISRIKSNKDLSIFSLYYQIINLNYKNKILLVKQIQELKSTLRILENENVKLNKILAIYFIDFTNIDELDTTLKPLKDLINIHQDKLANFDNSNQDRFNESLKVYLETGVHNRLEIEDFSLDINYSLDKIVEAIKKTQMSIIYNFSFKNLLDKKINSSENLAKLIDILLELGVYLDNKFIIEVLNYLNAYSKNRDLVLRVLMNKNLITIEVLTEFVNVKDWDWVYEFSLNSLVNMNDVAKIFSSMIRNNAYNCAKRVLISLENKLSFQIKKVLLKEKKDNNTRKLFILFDKIYSSAKFFSIKSVKYENLAIVLRNFFIDYFPKDVDAPIINDIIFKRTFDINGKKIESIYNRIQKGYKKIFSSTLNTLLLYTKSKCSHLDYFSYDKVITQYAHFRKNLFIKELLILDELLISLILLNEDNENIINETYILLKQNKDIIYRLKKINLSFQNRLIVGKKIIQYLRKNKLNILRTIIYQIENDRLVLENIINL